MSKTETTRSFNRFMARADKLALRYPVAALRPRLEEVLTLFREKKVIFSPCHTYSSGLSGGLLGGPVIRVPVTCQGRHFQTFVYFWAPSWRDEEIAFRHSLPQTFARRCFDDLTMLSLLHEGFHLTEQILPGPAELPTVSPWIDYEVACWAYTCTEVIQPMVAHGRAPYLVRRSDDCLFRHMNAFFELVGCNVQSPIWRRFIELEYQHDATPLPKTT